MMRNKTRVWVAAQQKASGSVCRRWLGCCCLITIQIVSVLIIAAVRSWSGLEEEHNHGELLWPMLLVREFITATPE